MTRTQKWIYKDGETEIKVEFTKPILGLGAKINIDGMTFPIKGICPLKEHSEPFRLGEQAATLQIDKLGNATIRVDNQVLEEVKA